MSRDRLCPHRGCPAPRTQAPRPCRRNILDQALLNSPDRGRLAVNHLRQKRPINHPSIEQMCYSHLVSGLIGTKWCGDCKDFRRVVEFSYKYSERRVLQTYCKICQSRRSREHYQRNADAYKERIARNNQITRGENRRKLLEYLSHEACVDCGLTDMVALEFDHHDPTQKVRDVSTMVQKGFAWTTVLREMSKCDIVCANCHRVRTAHQFSWHKIAPRIVTLPVLPRRGTADYERIKSRRSGLARRDRNRLLVWNYLRTHSCALCGESNPVVLEFDHLTKKLHDIGWLIPASCTARILTEIEKCRVLCANCHRRHTAAQHGRVR